MIPKRKPSKGRLGTREDAGPMRCSAFLQWLRGCECWAKLSGVCAGERIQAAHYSGPEVPAEDRGGTGLKPSDRWAVPLCHACHRLQHAEGHQSFDHRVGAKMADAAASYWQHWTWNTAAGRKWRAEHGE